MPAPALQFRFPVPGGPTVMRMGFGAMRICGPGTSGMPDDVEAAKAVLRRAVELGINLIDTADAYGPETNEAMIAEALHPYPKDLVIATKGGIVRPSDRSWQRDGRPEHLRAACEASLNRLKTEQIDLYQLHAVDEKVAFADQVGALAQLRDQGKIAMVGLSNVSVDQLREAQTIVPIASVQNRFNYADQSHAPVLAECDRLGVAFLPWRPLATGDLAQDGSLVAAIAAELDATPAQVALAWLLQLSPAVIPIPGTSKIDHLEEDLAAIKLELNDQHMRQLGRLVNGQITQTPMQT